MKQKFAFLIALLPIFAGQLIQAQSPAPACTLYVASSGSSHRSGVSSASPTTLLHASSIATAGAVICIKPGTYDLDTTFYPAHSGTASAWITYTAHGDGAVNIIWTGGANAGDENMFHMYSRKFPDGPSYIQFNGLTLNGQNAAENGFFCQNSHHLKYTRNVIENMGSSGIGSVDCDYQTADHNIVYHNGYIAGWSSGISFNSNQWFDSYSGFHNVVANNFVAGSFDASNHHSDGNGIIMDLSNGTYKPSSANTPPALIVNNVVYGNGGRCIENFVVTNIWVINNTCYDNDLDLKLGAVGEIVSNSANTEVFANNIVQSWGNHQPFQAIGTVTAGTMKYHNNLIYGGRTAGTPSAGFTTANPLFLASPVYNETADGQYASTVHPSTLGADLQLQAASPAIEAGIDPTTLATNASLKSDMAAYVYSDILGIARPIGGPFTLGAYQVTAAASKPIRKSNN